MTKYLVTGASGQLGQKVVDHLATLVPARDIVALVRSDSARESFEAKGIAARQGDYENPEALRAAFDGIDRVKTVGDVIGGSIGRSVEFSVASGIVTVKSKF